MRDFCASCNALRRPQARLFGDDATDALEPINEPTASAEEPIHGEYRGAGSLNTKSSFEKGRPTKFGAIAAKAFGVKAAARPLEKTPTESARIRLVGNGTNVAPRQR